MWFLGQSATLGCTNGFEGDIGPINYMYEGFNGGLILGNTLTLKRIHI